jgi:hypothetical protein
VAAAIPVNRHNRLIGCVVEVNDDFPDEDVRDPLLRPRIGAGRIPCGRQVMRQ